MTEPRRDQGRADAAGDPRAAIARFGRDGYRSTSVADIARDAGVGGTAAYAYFASKEALFLAAIDEDAAGVINEGLVSVVEQPYARLAAGDPRADRRGRPPPARPPRARRPRARGHRPGARDARARRAAQGVAERLAPSSSPARCGPTSIPRDGQRRRRHRAVAAHVGRAARPPPPALCGRRLGGVRGGPRTSRAR